MYRSFTSSLVLTLSFSQEIVASPYFPKHSQKPQFYWRIAEIHKWWCSEHLDGRIACKTIFKSEYFYFFFLLNFNMLICFLLLSSQQILKHERSHTFAQDSIPSQSMCCLLFLSIIANSMNRKQSSLSHPHHSQTHSLEISCPTPSHSCRRNSTTF